MMSEFFAAFVEVYGLNIFFVMDNFGKNYGMLQMDSMIAFLMKIAVCL